MWFSLRGETIERFLVSALHNETVALTAYQCIADIELLQICVNACMGKIYSCRVTDIKTDENYRNSLGFPLWMSIFVSVYSTAETIERYRSFPGFSSS